MNPQLPPRRRTRLGPSDLPTEPEPPDMVRQPPSSQGLGGTGVRPARSVDFGGRRRPSVDS